MLNDFLLPGPGNTFRCSKVHFRINEAIILRALCLAGLKLSALPFPSAVRLKPRVRLYQLHQCEEVRLVHRNKLIVLQRFCFAAYCVVVGREAAKSAPAGLK